MKAELEGAPVSVDTIRFDEKGLVPAVVQDGATGAVLMVAYMNRESLEKSLETGETWFYSRSRQELWHKGGTSGHTQRIETIAVDCDQDCLLVTVRAAGPACHTGEVSCFYRNLKGEGIVDEDFARRASFYALADEIADLHEHPREKSYTAYLLSCGVDKIGKKIGEEGAEVIIAAKNGDATELVNESADLLYHLAVLWENNGVTIDDVMAELQRRSQVKGNKKEVGHLDKTF